MAPSKRFQVMLRPEIAEIVEDLAEQDNLSASKVCGILIEAALAQRSLWDRETRKRIPSDLGSDPHSKSVNREDIFESLPPTVVAEKVMTKTKQPEQDLNLDPELLELAKKLQALKALDLL